MSQEVNTMFQYNGVKYEFDVRDADASEKFENAVEKMREEEAAISKIGKSSELIRAHCKLIKDFFDRVLEDGAGNAVCTEKNNISICYAAYEAFLEVVRLQRDDILRAKNTFGKYSNRQQRRAANKKK